MNVHAPQIVVPEVMTAQAIDIAMKSLQPNDPFTQMYLGIMRGDNRQWVQEMRASTQSALVAANAIAKAIRTNSRASKFPSIEELQEKGEISKATLDVGTLTNFATITGGQSLGYVSLDTQMARATVRPNSFTLYMSLHKSAAFQVVDYWSVAQETGGNLPGTAFQGFSNVSSGTLATAAGVYNLQNVTLKLAVNGRAITTALAAQNSFVDIAAQENINAALTVLESVNWTCYFGNPTLFPNQFPGIENVLTTTAGVSGNIFDFQAFSNSYATAQSWNPEQTLFNLIYEAAGIITGYKQNGRITHAFMSPTCAGALQILVTTLLNNIVVGTGNSGLQGIIVDGDLQGMKTRFGQIQFPIDLFITARDKPAQAILNSDGTTMVTSPVPGKPVSVVGAIVSGSAATGTAWTTSYVAASGIYSYAVASLDTNMYESALTYLASGLGSGSTLTISGVGTTTAYQLTITPPVAADAAAFRVYRSGLGYLPATSGTANPAAYRFIGTVAANAGTPVTFTDLNTKIPGSETVFLLDMDDADNAIDYRFLLPLTKVELFAQNLYMPWAVCSIGSLRVRIPRFHGLIKNAVMSNPNFNPLAANANAT